jgi:hypothetical protein
VILFIGYALIALVVAGVLCYAVIAFLPDGLSVRAEADKRPFELPADRQMAREDLERVRIPIALRGYRFAETDDLLDRLAAELAVRDEEIVRLRSAMAPGEGMAPAETMAPAEAMAPGETMAPAEAMAPGEPQAVDGQSER